MDRKRKRTSKRTTASALRAGAAALRKEASRFAFEAHLFNAYGIVKYESHAREREVLLAQAAVLEELVKTT